MLTSLRTGATNVRLPSWSLASLAGVPVATLLALVPGVWPALAIAAGAVATTAAVLVVGRERADYAVAGTAYCLALAGVLSIPGLASESHAGSPRIVLATLGAASACFVAGRLLLGELLARTYRRAVGKGRRSKLQTARTTAKLLGVARTAVGLVGRLGRVGVLLLAAIGAVVFAGVAGFLLDGLGVAAPIPWLVVESVALAHVLFVGALLAGFHALEAARSTWVSTREGVGVGKSAASRLLATVRRYRADDAPED